MSPAPMRVVVAGGTGFLGRHISRALLDAGFPVSVLSRSPHKVGRIPELSGADAEHGDVTDPGALEGVLDGAGAVVMAAQFPNHPVEVPRKGLTYDNYDRRGTQNLLAEAERAGVERFFYISGANASEFSSRSWYRAKGRAEASLRAGRISFAILRPSWAYGPEDRALNRFNLIARLSPVLPRLGWGPQRIQPVFVKDIAIAVATIFQRDDAWNATYEIGGPEMTMHEVMETLLAVTGRRRVILPVPVPLLKLACAPMVLLPRPPMSPRAIDFAVQEGLVDNRAIEALGIRVRPLRDGLEEYLKP